mmetsp:Transcript_124315/g.284862  ORF Transcript_124315/g.284862 Transcript_124315/m.284862 type:complete len:213 (+) Transcript_124315:1834-2472(+)
MAGTAEKGCSGVGRRLATGPRAPTPVLASPGGLALSVGRFRVSAAARPAPFGAAQDFQSHLGVRRVPPPRGRRAGSRPRQAARGGGSAGGPPPGLGARTTRGAAHRPQRCWGRGGGWARQGGRSATPCATPVGPCRRGLGPVRPKEARGGSSSPTPPAPSGGRPSPRGGPRRPAPACSCAVLATMALAALVTNWTVTCMPVCAQCCQTGALC